MRLYAALCVRLFKHSANEGLQSLFHMLVRDDLMLLLYVADHLFDQCNFATEIYRSHFPLNFFSQIFACTSLTLSHTHTWFSFALQI